MPVPDEYDARLLALLRSWVAERGTLSVFSALCRKDLRTLGLTAEAVELLEADCDIGNYRDAHAHRAHRKEVSRILRIRGVKLSRGKRARAELEAFVGRLTSTLRALGVDIASGENARAVRILRRIADELQLPGDPRDQLRRSARIEKAAARYAYVSVLKAAIAGARPDDRASPD